MANSGSSGDLSLEILQRLSISEPLQTSEAFPNANFVEIKAALDRLRSRDMIVYETIEKEEVVLEPEGEEIAKHGSHEARVFEALRVAMDGLTIPELEKAIGDKAVTKLGQGKAFKEKWISKTKDGKLVSAVRLCSNLRSGHFSNVDLCGL
jgi:phenylalanyl-tRNA synthetase alpha chain